MTRSRNAFAFVGAALLAAVLALLLVPEWRELRGKRRIREGQDLLVAAAGERDASARAGVLRDAQEVLENAAADLPHDPRPAYLLGSIDLLRGDFAGALDRYRRSLAIEERPETDLNLSRAHSGAGEPDAAAVDALRAFWLAPELMRDLPEAARADADQQVRRRARQFYHRKADVPELWGPDVPGPDNR